MLEKEIIQNPRADLKTTNPKLHKMYLDYAINILNTAQKAREALSDYSNINCYGLVGAITKEIKELVDNDPIYMEAAAFLFVGAEEIPPYFNHSEYETVKPQKNKKSKDIPKNGDSKK